MARKTKDPSEEAETTSATVVVEEQPLRGGSYVRDPVSGALTQTEGHDFAEQPATTQE